MLPGLERFSHEERLVSLELFSLKQRRPRGEMGEIFNEYFSLVFTVENIMGAKEIMETSGDVLGHRHITREEVSATLKCIKMDKSPGSDQVHPQILWEAREEIAEAFAEIFASSLSTGEVAED